MSENTFNIIDTVNSKMFNVCLNTASTALKYSIPDDYNFCDIMLHYITLNYITLHYITYK